MSTVVKPITQNADIRYLGKLLGDVIRAYGGNELFQRIENIRSSSVDRHRGIADPAALTTIARAAVDAERDRLRAGDAPTSIEDLAADVTGTIASFADPTRSGLVPVINATGVILHTNLGRAPWAAEAIEAARQAAAGYSLLELDRDSGRRGPRFRAAETHK